MVIYQVFGNIEHYLYMIVTKEERVFDLNKKRYVYRKVHKVRDHLGNVVLHISVGSQTPRFATIGWYYRIKGRQKPIKYLTTNALNIDNEVDAIKNKLSKWTIDGKPLRINDNEY